MMLVKHYLLTYFNSILLTALLHKIIQCPDKLLTEIHINTHHLSVIKETKLTEQLGSKLPQSRQDYEHC